VRRRERRATEVFSLSFLDCICCGFGAIILLFVLNKGGEPQAIASTRADAASALARLEEQLARAREEAAELERVRPGQVEQISQERARIARLQGDLSSIHGEFRASRELSEVQEIVEGRLVRAQQQLSDEMRRLQQQAAFVRPSDTPVGGIPVDSEYVVFIIDSSGSMQRYGWNAMRRKISEVLDAYPRVKGMQVMNDDGIYLFGSYAGKWMPDTPSIRRNVVETLRNWTPKSNSSPVEGIELAIRTYWTPDRQVSLYVLGDEFSGESAEAVVREVDRLNRPDASGKRRVRIHAVGFPTMFSQSQWPEVTGWRFASLMRVLCERNGGAFVALNALE
jgi:hypothetical protein